MLRRSLARSQIWSATLARNVPIATQSLRSFAVVSGKDIPSPKIEDIQFNVIGEINVEYPSRPWETPSKAELSEGVLQKARETQQIWDNKIDSTSPDALLFKNIFDLKPYDEAALKKELEEIKYPRIQATVEQAFNTKDHYFITEYLASRMASYVEDPAFYFSYGENPSVGIKPNWDELLVSNISKVLGEELIQSLSESLQQHEAAKDVARRVKAGENQLIHELQDDLDLVSNKERLTKTLQDMNAFDPQQIAQMIDILSIEPLADNLIPLIKSQSAERAAQGTTPGSKSYDEFISTAQELVKELKAHGLRIDPAQVLQA